MHLHRPARADARVAVLSLVAVAALATTACDAARTATPAPAPACTRCHGGERSADGAPPRDLAGRSDGPSVGAHQAHLARGVACAECHLVPAGSGADAHLRSAPATTSAPGRARLTFGPRAGAGGVTPRYDFATATCTVYCHGASLGADGPAAPPRWGQAGPLGCGGCHGAPPASPPHAPALTLGTCARCHPDTVDPSGALLAGGRHLDGRVDALDGGCATCHGDASRPEATTLLQAAPPHDAAGGAGPAVGAHQAHLHDGPLARAFACAECHVVPGDAGHAASSGPTVALGASAGALAAAGGVTPAWSAGRCSVYCHGASLAGGTSRQPGWTDGPGAVGADALGDAARCGSCHGFPPPAPHPQAGPSGAPLSAAGDCSGCHAGTVDPSGAVSRDLHVDGRVELSGAHPVPWAPAQHGPAALAGLGACRGCHGASLAAPLGGQGLGCDGCHAQAGHPTWQRECTFCHGDAARAADAAFPLAGTPPLALNLAGPPRAATGRPVGAHLAHVSADPAVGNKVSRPIGCEQCHGAAPADLGHVDGRVQLAWGPLALARGAAPAPEAGPLAAAEEPNPGCANACHGAGLTGGSRTAPRWSDGAQAGACGTCHGWPPDTHPAAAAGRCQACHPGTVDARGRLDVAGGLHVNGKVEADVRCDACHGAPPATGAHRRHATRAAGLVAYRDVRVLEEVDPSNAAGQADYAFGCGTCHPLDPARHLDGTVQVDLSPAGAPAGSLKARNAPGAAYDPATGRCSGVACHSSGQEAPTFVATTPWRGGPDPAGCAGCHGNPPWYSNGGAGSATANAHLALDRPEIGVYSGSWGHLRSSHSMPHGGEYDGFGWRPPHGSPRTCQACHFDTVDPANTAPGGFFYLDTTVRTLVQIPANRPADVLQECQVCHTGQPGAPPAGQGRALPLRHVNGRRDVVFDPRTQVPPGYYAAVVAPLPAPVAPYFFTNAFYDFYSDMLPYLTPATVLSGQYGTVSFPLTEARYDPANKTCTSVACHYQQSTPTSPPLRWGDLMSLPEGGCNSCH